MIIDKNLEKLGYQEPDAPIIALSGKIETLGTYQENFQGQQSGDINLSGAELNVAAALNAWVEGFLAFTYDSSPPTNQGQRVNNSNIFLNKGFINIGNLERTPFYLTAGQIYVPFGRYSSSMVSAPMTLSVGRTKARTVILGFRQYPQEGLFAAAYGFKSDTTNQNRATGGLNIGYQIRSSRVRGEVGMSLLRGINDAGGMQLTGLSGGQFAGFGATTANEAVDKIPAIDLNGNINFDAISLTGEWLTTTQAFRLQDLSFNGRGAQPQALNIEAAYTFKAFDNKPASVALGYGQTKDALALGLPKQRIAAVFNISLWQDTVESLEYRHDIDYTTSDSASGINATANTNGTGRSSDTVTAQLSIFF